LIQLLKYELLTADKHMQCDALTVRLDMSKTLTIEQAFKGIETWFNARKGISIGDSYWHYDFLDNETGEILEMNCRIDMNKLMVENDFYPPYIKNAFKKYKQSI